MTEKRAWLYDLLFVLVLLLAGYLRLTGVEWGEGYHQHPDELFLSGVLENLRAHTCTDPAIALEACPPDQQRWLSIGEYFDSARSTLNPYNRGYAFFVYGTLPMFIVRYAAEWNQVADLSQLRFLSRQFSALADLFTIFLLYSVVSRVYNQRVGLLAALFSALTVMQIQQSHFFTTDLFTNLFMYLAIFFAAEIVFWNSRKPGAELSPPPPLPDGKLPAAGTFVQLVRHPLFLLSTGFGIALGMAMASKINAGVLAFMLPGAFLIRFAAVDRRKPSGSMSASSALLIDDWLPVIIFLIAGGIATIVSFRVFQPYAFDGLGLNPQWVANIQEQRVQARGDADLPWNLQWARRSHFYSFINLTVWGLGLPLGILAWVGFLLMGWRILKGEWRHILLWSWAAFYFVWQSLQFNPTMRYQLPVYPVLAMMAAWAVLEAPGYLGSRKTYAAIRNVAYAVGGVVLALTAVWAFAFHSIYLRAEPRMAASRWIYANVPGPINLQIQTDEDGIYSQPLPFPTGTFIQPGAPYQTAFIAQTDGQLEEVLLAHVAAVPNRVSSQLYLTVWQDLNDSQPLASAVTTVPAQNMIDDTSQVATFDQAPVLTTDQTYHLMLELAAFEGSVQICGAAHIFIQTADQTAEQIVDISDACTVSRDSPYTITFIPETAGALNSITLEHVANAEPSTQTDPKNMHLFISREPEPAPGQSAVSASLTSTFAASDDPRGEMYTLALSEPVQLERGTQYYLRIETDSGLLSISGSAIANETDYDWGLPFRVDGYDPFGGMYRGDLILQVYWDDNEDKLRRFVDILSQADYIAIPTNHQYAQITRLPERYPLTTFYYRELLGCPEKQDIIDCYRAAQPGQFQGGLGFELAAVFESYPRLGSLVINDQAAEEAFTFYDHPKVLIFKKSADFSPAKLNAALGSVDLSSVVHLTPRQAASYKSLMLPMDRLTQQRAGGTWSELFDYDWIQNRYPLAGMLVWYAFIFVLGLVVYPVVRLALPGLGLYSYPVSRILGLVLLAWLSWMAGSLGIPYTRLTIAAAFALIAVGGLGLGWLQRDRLREEWRGNYRFILTAEILFVSFFALDLLIRLGNSDMWHPAKGGERPMDFSYFNAVLKSTSFPPYDPWFAGGYINYYYYGFVLVGTPVKLLGIVPSLAYNFILPTLFALVAGGAFTVGWNLVESRAPDSTGAKSAAFDIRLLTGLAAAVMVVLIGNLGTVRFLFQTFQRMAAPGGMITDANFIQRWIWAIKGFVMSFGATALPVGRGDWYWFPSRVIPAPGDVEPINEFPLFTFLYSDLHAHMIVLPITMFILAWTVSFLKSHARMKRREWFTTLIIGALMVGALKPTNTWDLYTYFPLTALAILYTVLRYFDWKNRFGLPDTIGRLMTGLGLVALLYILGAWLYAPFSHWFSQGYGSVAAWAGTHTPIWSYLTHWGLFLFIIVAWLTWETREWMANTPLSALNRLRPYQFLIEVALALLLTFLIYFAIEGISVGWLALPLAAWAGVLLLKPGMSGVKRGVLMMIGTALVLTIAVEMVVLVGDIGRMNTVFKLYLQGWTLFAVSAAAAFGWLLNAFPHWNATWRNVYQIGMAALLTGAFLFTITATADKIVDRMAPDAPRTLDSMTFMKSAIHWDGDNMELSEDYNAIRWMQDNVQGSPVIVEANCTEYRWCTRFTIYTGLPGVVGWNFHQRQQRALIPPELITDRIVEISLFYTTAEIEPARQFLKKYQVKYIIVGQLERNIYPPSEAGDGLAKFEQYNGKYWRSVFRDDHTVVYETLP